MLFYLTFAFLLASAQAKFYKDCGSKLATISNVGVSDCESTATECILKKSSNVSITIDFTPTRDVKTVETIVHGIIMNLPVPFPLPQPDACKDSGLSCPVKAGTEIHYTATLPVHKTYPEIAVKVKWELKTEDDEDLVCIIINAKLK